MSKTKKHECWSEVNFEQALNKIKNPYIEIVCCQGEWSQVLWMKSYTHYLSAICDFGVNQIRTVPKQNKTYGVALKL